MSDFVKSNIVYFFKCNTAKALKVKPFGESLGYVWVLVRLMMNLGDWELALREHFNVILNGDKERVEANFVRVRDGLLRAPSFVMGVSQMNLLVNDRKRGDWSDRFQELFDVVQVGSGLVVPSIFDAYVVLSYKYDLAGLTMNKGLIEMYSSVGSGGGYGSFKGKNLLDGKDSDLVRGE